MDRDLIVCDFMLGVKVCSFVYVYRYVLCIHLPSSIERCMASLAFLGTLSITSRPSLISPFPSSQHVNNSYKERTHTHKRCRTRRISYGNTFSKGCSVLWLYVICGVWVDEFSCQSVNASCTLRRSWYLVILWTGLIR